MNPIDLYRATNLLIQQRGANAKAHASERVCDMRNARNKEGELTWMGVLDAILVLKAKQPAPGRPSQ